MRASTAFFAGIGTVVVAIAAGLSGGLLIANMMNAKLPREAVAAAPIERRAVPDQMPVSGGVRYAAATLAFTDPSVDRAGVPDAKNADGNNATPPAPHAAEATASNDPAPGSADAAKPAPQSSQVPATDKQVSAPDDANAKARDTDLKRAVEKRRAERAQRWAERRRRREQQNNFNSQARDDSDWNYPDRRYRVRRYDERRDDFTLFGPD